LKIAEIFYSIQGEGIYIGLPAIFVRVTGCNLKCSFCDTKYALTEGTEMSMVDIIKQIKSYSCELIVFTGGEPLLYQDQVTELMESLLNTSLFYFFEIETNGKITPTKRMLELVDSWVVSPKLKNSGVKPYELGDWIYSDDITVTLKFVVDKESDLHDISIYVDGMKAFDTNNIFLMPQATTTKEQEEKLPLIIDFAKKFGYRVTPRLQILAYGLKRGV